MSATTGPRTTTMCNVSALPPKDRKKTAKRAALERAAWTEIHRFVDERASQFFDACEAADLTPPQAALLLKIEPGNSYSMASLASARSCHASNITGLVDRLEERGILERRPSAEDRRVKHISLTQKGVLLRERLLDRMYDPPPAHFSVLEEKELEALTHLMQRLRNAL